MEGSAEKGYGFFRGVSGNVHGFLPDLAERFHFVGHRGDLIAFHSACFSWSPKKSW
jgi:hypothetical protein